MSLAADPIALFREWAALARQTDIVEPDAAALATVDGDGNPSARMVLVRDADERGFVFYTNLGSPKAKDLSRAGGRRAPAALCFWWPPILKQVRVDGAASPVTDQEADAYWATRHRGSQVAAWASRQSAELTGGRPALEARFAELDRNLPAEKVPRPPFWNGFRITPERIEFWEGREHRLHHRVLYVREGNRWAARILSP